MVLASGMRRIQRLLYQSVGFEGLWHCGLKLQMLYRASVSFLCQGRPREQKFKLLHLIQFIQCILHCAGKKPVFGGRNSSSYQATRKKPQAKLNMGISSSLFSWVCGGCVCMFGLFLWTRSLAGDFKQMQKDICIYICKMGCN